MKPITRESRISIEGRPLWRCITPAGWIMVIYTVVVGGGAAYLMWPLIKFALSKLEGR